MTCYKCEGHLCQDPMYDLPGAYREYYCVNCGQRFWIDARTLTMEVGPMGSGFMSAAAARN